MDLVELGPRLHLLRFPVGQAYLWRDGDDLTLIDSGPPGSDTAIVEAVEALGLHAGALRRIVLTHFHGDHTGGAGRLAARHRVPVLAHRADAPVVRGELPPAPPSLTDAPEWERALFEQVHAESGSTADRPVLLAAPPVPVDRELGGVRAIFEDQPAASDAVHRKAEDHPRTGRTWVRPTTQRGAVAGVAGPRRSPGQCLGDGDVLGFAGGAGPGTAMLGVFNTDRPRAAAALRRLAALPVGTACFGHGEPVTEDAAGALRRAAAPYS